MDNPDWMTDALCAGEDPEIFFPDRTPGRRDQPRFSRAVKICMKCPVRALCLDWAVATEDRFAILGGMTAQQRSLHRNRKSNERVRAGSV